VSVHRGLSVVLLSNADTSDVPRLDCVRKSVNLLGTLRVWQTATIQSNRASHGQQLAPSRRAVRGIGNFL